MSNETNMDGNMLLRGSAISLALGAILCTILGLIVWAWMSVIYPVLMWEIRNRLG